MTAAADYHSYIQAGYINKPDSCNYHFAERNNNGDGFRVVENGPGWACANPTTTYDYGEWSGSGGTFGAYVNGIQMLSDSVAGWATPYYNIYSGEVIYSASDIPGTSSAPAKFNNMVVRDSGGTWHYAPCGMVGNSPTSTRYKFSTDGSCIRFSIWTDPL